MVFNPKTLGSGFVLKHQAVQPLWSYFTRMSDRVTYLFILAASLRILVLQPAIEPMPQQWNCRVLTTGLSREVPGCVKVDGTCLKTSIAVRCLLCSSDENMSFQQSARTQVFVLLYFPLFRSFVSNDFQKGLAALLLLSFLSVLPLLFKGRLWKAGREESPGQVIGCCCVRPFPQLACCVH